MTLRSRYLTEGAETAPQRSLLYACGFTKEELERYEAAVERRRQLTEMLDGEAPDFGMTMQ